jgi:hypothetical protein
LSSGLLPESKGQAVDKPENIARFSRRIRLCRHALHGQYDPIVVMDRKAIFSSAPTWSSSGNRARVPLEAAHCASKGKRAHATGIERGSNGMQHRSVSRAI